VNSFPEVKIGIIGLGYVGSAILNSISDRFGMEIVIIDPDKGHTSTYNDLAGAEAVFVCVPTPRSDSGNCDTSILEDVLARLHNIRYTGVIISKCTAPPNVYQKLNEQYPNLVHVPEFLTAADAMRDYLNGSFGIIGGSIKAYMNEAERFTKISQQNLKTIVHCDIGEAALAKYAINSFLATKVVFMNELHKVAEAAGLDYNVIATMIKLDLRIGDSHMRVPGPDGTFGFGGHCLPKDTEALLSLSKDLGVTMQVLETALKKNLLLRLS
jgi:UDPglucose 6-dehydrogenase